MTVTGTLETRDGRFVLVLDRMKTPMELACVAGQQGGPSEQALRRARAGLSRSRGAGYRRRGRPGSGGDQRGSREMKDCLWTGEGNLLREAGRRPCGRSAPLLARRTILR